MLVKFGNNWIQKIPRTAKLDSAVAILGIFLIQLFPNWTACSPITYTNTNEIPGELSRENMISSHVKITCYLHV